MNLSKSSRSIQNLAVFRKLMGLPLLKNDVIRVFGEKSYQLFLEETANKHFEEIISGKEFENTSATRKLRYVEGFVKKFQILGLVKYIAVTGSIAAGSASENDDIDIFIVTKNHRSWVYRGLLMLRMYKGILHVEDDSHMDKFCVNFISEERGLTFENHDMFTFHEIFFMKPIYKSEYFNTILQNNKWVVEDFCAVPAERTKEQSSSKIFTPLFVPLNFIAMLTQYAYMIVRGHNPIRRRIFSDYREGRIAFYPQDFRDKKMSDFKKVI